MIEAADLVRMAMQRLGATRIADLARALELDPYVSPNNTIGRWLKGETRPGYETTMKLLAIVGALNVEALESGRLELAEAERELARELERAQRARGLEAGAEGRAAPPRRGKH